ncbi:MAG TPA: TIGR03620 family F420-dependent LLM class oxidoreductase [Myxococcales bacterium]|nr:TIGR03620 family F420-dependent LLM class oxidoreductase [Myxococcales bacterium]
MTDTKTSDVGGPGGSSAVGRTGVWIRTDAMTARETAELSRRVEALGYGAFWFPEIQGRNAFVQAGWLLAATERLHVATGIANIFLRDPYATAAAQRTLAEQSEGRFVLGLGVSHASFVERVLGRQYRSPVSALEGYLDRMEGIVYDSPEPKTAAPTVLAALAPRLLRLAARRTAGSHSYLVPPEHTARARETLGPEPWLCVEQKVLLERTPSKARRVARQACAFYLRLAHYQKSLRRLGFGDDDLADGGSDRLIDALVAWGNEQDLARRLREHRDAGATHVCIQPIDPEGSPRPDPRALEALAPSGGIAA